MFICSKFVIVGVYVCFSVIVLVLWNVVAMDKVAMFRVDVFVGSVSRFFDIWIVLLMRLLEFG